jgi:hypothetical protein
VAKTDQELAQDILNNQGINWKYGGDTIAGALMPFRREVLAPEQSQFIGYDDRGQAIIQNIPAQYGETQFDLSYSPAVQSLQGVGSALRDVFFGDANTQAKAINQAVSALRGVAGGIADYASGQYKAAMGGGTIYDPSTREVTEFDPTAVLLANAPAGIQAVRNAPSNTMTLGAAGGRMNPPRDIHAEVASAKAAYDSDPNNEELRRSYMALRRERDAMPPAPSNAIGSEPAIPEIQTDDYRGAHEPPDREYGAPLNDLTSMIPSDVYGPAGPRLYGFCMGWQRLNAAHRYNQST